ncbi:protein YcdU [Escherichia coli]
MIPDYLTFIRFQDKRNLIYIYAIGLILIGFYWKNAGFTFPSEDIGVVSGILALVLYNFIFDLKAYWDYKCVTKNIDFSWFKKKQNHKIELFLTQPLVAGFLSLIMLSAMSWGLYQLLPSLYALFLISLLGPLVIFLLFRMIRTSYVKQVAISVAKKVKYKSLTRYVLLSVCISTVVNLLTISPLRNSDSFVTEGQWLTFKSIIALLILCGVVLAINLFFLRFSKRYAFLGRLFLQEIDLFFSSENALSTFFAKPLWLRLFILLVIEMMWITLVSVLATLVEWRIWFEAYFLLCYVPCLIYYFFHCRCLWHNDFMMACDMYFRWGHFNK